VLHRALILVHASRLDSAKAAAEQFGFSLDLSHQVSGRGSRTLNPRAAADLARFIRRVTGGMDSNWLHLLVTGRPRRLAELVLAMEDRKNR
jgi:hypothetical protein